MPANNAYVCENPYRLVPSSATDLYAKGSLTEAKETKDIAWGTFGIVTTDRNIRQKIDSAATVRVQRNVVGDYAECTSIGGGVFPLLLNGQKFVDQDAVHHPRTMIGAKADGTVVMVTVDGRQKASGMHGMTSDELGAVMQYYGCVSAVNLDGGGSTTIAIRDENNKFKILNSPSDGSERNDANCYLVVMKQADFEISSTESLPDSITFNLDTSSTNFDTITNIKCTLNGVTKEVVDNKVTFDGLESNKSYDYVFSYDTKEEKNIKTLLAGIIYSSRQVPTFGPLDIQISGNKITFIPSINDPDGALNYYRIFINNRREPFLDEPIVVNMNLEGLEEITFDVLISYDLNNGLDKIDKTESYSYNIKTGELRNLNDPVDEPTEEPTDDKKSGCKKEASIIIISIISLSSLLAVFKRREK